MKNHPRIQSIFIAPTAGAPMQALPNAEILETGIKGDRYASGDGAYSNTSPKKIRHISLITQSGIATANEWLSAGGEDPFNEAQTRRNIVLSNMSAGDLNLLVGQTFKLGEVILRGTELCTPCTRPSELLNKSGFLDAFDGRGGLRAEIMKVGTISIGDILVCEPKGSR
jgi:MOSC domain-containing protein YiiM